MKKQLNEIQRMQQLAGIKLNELEVNMSGLSLKDEQSVKNVIKAIKSQDDEVNTMLETGEYSVGDFIKVDQNNEQEWGLDGLPNGCIIWMVDLDFATLEISNYPWNKIDEETEESREVNGSSGIYYRIAHA